jgi:citronellol/citronellal dehydrogenase
MLEIEAAKKSPFAPGLFAGKVALVTGGGTGIGRATVEELLSLGAKVAICSRKPEHLEPAAREMARLGEVFAARCDIREASDVERVVGEVLERFGRIDVLVNNAGGQFPAPATAISPKGFEAVVRNNLSGTFFMTREVATRAMLPARRGAIVMVTANAARGFPGMAHTGAARAGVENLTRTLAIEWAPEDVRVNAVAPGLIRSSGTAQYGEAVVEQGRQRTPQKRAGAVEEVAHAICYLASPAAAFVTGAILHIDGGQSLWGDLWPIPDRSAVE